MKALLQILILTLLASQMAIAQTGVNKIREGNQLYENRDYTLAEALYKESLVENENSDIARFNLANSLYRQKKYEASAKAYQDIAKKSEDKQHKARAYHNMGNALLKDQKIDESIDAYKHALRNNPGDEDTRYNLSYAQQLKKQQEEQEQEQQQDQQDQDQDQQEQNQDQQNQDQQEQEQEQEQDQDQQQNQDQQEQEQEQQQQQQQQQQPPELSKEDAERLLEALNNEEKEVQDKLKKDKANVKKIQIEKDW